MLATREQRATFPAGRRALARVVTELLAPANVAGGLLVLVAWHSAATTADALRRAGVAVLFAAVVPMAYIIRGVRRQRLNDRHIRHRHQRPIPLLVGVGVLALGNARRELIALVAAMAVGLGTSLSVTLVWKISIHIAVVAGAVVILVLVFGPAAPGSVPLVALVAWARVALRDHTPGQAAAGAALGALVAASVFSLLR
jgi:hypothetical protein